MTRHLKRCGQAPIYLPRQKACNACSKAKVRCSAQQPRCDRCRTTSIACHYAAAAIVAPVTPPSSRPLSDFDRPEPSPDRHFEPPGFELLLSHKRRLELLGTAPGTPNSNPITTHAMRLVVQSLKAWMRSMAMQDGMHLPPMVHNLQLADGTPVVLARCSSLIRMWVDHDPNAAKLVQQTILLEVERLLSQVSTQDNPRWGSY